MGNSVSAIHQIACDAVRVYHLVEEPIDPLRYPIAGQRSLEKPISAPDSLGSNDDRTVFGIAPRALTGKSLLWARIIAS